MTTYPRGSEWRRWDLHVHSPLSILNNDFPHLDNGEPDWDTYIERIEKSGVAVVGVTDYFTIDGYKILKSYQEKGRLQGILLLPNIEFRLDKLIQPRGAAHPAKRLDFHVIFAEDVPPQDIEDHFLHDLNFVYEHTPYNTGQKYSLKKANLEALGQKLKSEDSSFTASPLQVGATTAVVSLEEVLRVLQANERFRGKYVLVLPAEDWDQIPWGGQDHLTRQTLLQAAHMVFASNPRTVAWCLGMAPYAGGPDQFVREFGALKPCIHGSDAHSVIHVGHACAKRGTPGHDCAEHQTDCEPRHCWVKADPTFEGLKQLLYEPSDRVCIGVASPVPIKSNYSLARVRIQGADVNDELSVSSLDLELNENLVAITGGRGSGKTAFVDLIANSYTDRAHSDDPNSFVRRISDDNPALKVNLVFKDGQTFEKLVNDTNFFDQNEVVYIAQGELERYVGNTSDLNKYINDLIFNSLHIKNTVTAFEYFTLAETVEQIERDIQALNAELDELERQTASDNADAIEKEDKQVVAELKDLEARIKEYEKNISPERRAVATQRQQALTELERKRTKLQELKQAIDDSARLVTGFVNGLSPHITRINALAAELGIQDVAFEMPQYSGADMLKTLRSQVETRTREVVGQVEKAQKDLRALEADIREHAKALARKEELQVKIQTLRSQFKRLQDRRKLLGERKTARNTSFTSLIQNVLAERDKYREVIALFGSEKNDVLAELEFVAEVVVDEEGLLRDAEAVVDKRQVEVYGDDRAPSAFKSLLGLYRAVAAGDDKKLSEVVVETARLADELRTKLKTARSISPANLYRCLFGRYISIRPAVQYKKTALSRLSLGQKATVLIKIYLAQGTNPIIVDSHDDHLDNEFIMDELVGAIRQAKKFRQVILASNNGNVVINSDAEQVIVAQCKDGVISYAAGSLENRDTRERALKVLEGGADAFRRRQEKYRIAAGR